MMIALYDAKFACVIASHVAGDATVTVSPRARRRRRLRLDEPPFTDVDKISTEPDNEALAGPCPAATPAAVTTAAPATPTPATAAKPDATSERTATTTPTRRPRPAQPPTPATHPPTAPLITGMPSQPTPPHTRANPQASLNAPVPDPSQIHPRHPTHTKQWQIAYLASRGGPEAGREDAA